MSRKRKREPEVPAPTLLTDSEIAETAATWVQYHRGGPNAPRDDKNFWAFERVATLVRKHPGDAWVVILAMVSLCEDRANDNECVLANIGAGPMEELLGKHGPDFIDAVELEARRWPAFRQMLTNVWPSTINESVWQRVLVASGRTQPSPEHGSN